MGIGIDAYKENSLTFNKENLYKAESKCREGRKLVKQSCEQKEPNFMYQALLCYTEALELYPRLIEPYLSLAYISLEYKQKDKAFLFLNKALELDPSNRRAKKLLEKTKAFNITKPEEIKENNIIKSRINRVSRIEEYKELKSIELKAKIKPDNFSILNELFTNSPNVEIPKDSIIERKINTNYLTKEQIQEAEKLKHNSRAVKATVNLNSEFMKLFKS